MINIHRSYYETGHEVAMHYYCSSMSWPTRRKRYIDENPDKSERARLNFMVTAGKRCLWFYGNCCWRDCIK